jgi:CBS domain-containing protein
MQARELMTTNVIAVSPDTPTREIARLLVSHGISAVPVVDSNGLPIGMVSDGDLLGRAEEDRQALRDWWLMLLAEGEALHPDFLATLRDAQLTAREVMSAPVVRITETTEAADIARLLAEYRIKRVPVVREGHIIGIVSRADLLRALTAEHLEQHGSANSLKPHGLLAGFADAIDDRFHHKRDPVLPSALHEPTTTRARGLTATDFQELTAGSVHHEIEAREEARRAAAEQRHRRVKDLIDHHIDDENWRSTLHRAREAAARGDKEFMLLRFPADLCTDRGRAINAALSDWPKALRGEAAEVYLRWERELKPGGFHLAARVLDFPGGFPGDIGLFLAWEK